MPFRHRTASDSVRLWASPIATILTLIMFLVTTFFGGGSSGNLSRPSYTAPQGNTLAGKTVVIDPGHGGFDVSKGDYGAMGVGPTPEKENVLAMGLYLRDLLEARGARVVMTRDKDQSPRVGTRFEGVSAGQLKARIDIANTSGADVYVSIHNDAHTQSNVTGTTTYYHTEAGRVLASYVQRSLLTTLGSVDRGIQPARFMVLVDTTMPAVLVEVGYVTNQREATLLSDAGYRRKAASAILNGLEVYFSQRGM